MSQPSIRYRIYQINMGRDSKRYAFFGSREIQHFKDMTFPPPHSIYDCVYEGTCNEVNPEELFETFNIRHPVDYRARSLSVSDVLEYVINGKSTFYFCDNYGFTIIEFK